MKNDNLNDTIQSLKHSLERLEVKVAYQEDTIEILNQTIIEQNSHIQDLQKKMDKVVDKLSNLSTSDMPSAEADERPPHY